jgi:hypothetical protein
MRTASVFALGLLLALICLPSPATAQTNMPGATHLSLVPDSPSAPTASNLSKSQSPVVPLAGALPGNQASVLRQLNDRASKQDPFGNAQWKNNGPETYRLEPLPYFTTRRAPSAPKSCAHILIRRMHSADSKMVLKGPNGTVDKMSVATGLPACREDIR